MGKLSSKQNILLNKYKKEQFNNFEKLPIEIINKIVSNLNINQKLNLRATDQRLRTIVDTDIKHEIRKTIFIYNKDIGKLLQNSILKTIEKVTESYLRIGVSPVVLTNVLEILRNNQTDTVSFNTLIENIKIILLKFYEFTETLLGDPINQQSRLMFLITFFDIIHLLNNKSIVYQNINKKSILITTTIFDAWFGVLWPRKSKSMLYPDNRNNFLVILAEMVISTFSEKPFTKVWDCSEVLCVYGKDCRHSTRKRSSKIIFELNIIGGEKLIKFMENTIINQQAWTKEMLPINKFEANLLITCREATKWGCFIKQYVKI